MKIDRIEVAIVSIPKIEQTQGRSGHLALSSPGHPLNFVVTQVHTDEDITGISEIPTLPPQTRETSDEVFVFIKNWLAPRLLGEDPFNLEKIWAIMNRISPVGVCPKGAIDTALYDIRGKALKTPVYNLLGGLCKERIPLVECTTVRSLDKPETMAKEAKQFVDDGYKGLRVKPGRGMEIELLAAIRDHVGWDVKLSVDAEQRWNVPKSIQKIKAMEKYDLEFLEQPTVWYDLKGMAAVAKAVDVPIMAHQSLYTLQDVDNLIKLEATDIIGVKAYRPGGGLTGTMKTMAMAEIMNIPCYIHCCAEAGISTAASVHLMAAQYDHLEYGCEISWFHGYASNLVKNPVKIERGFAEVPKTPGLGVELDEEAVKKYSKETAVIK